MVHLNGYDNRVQYLKLAGTVGSETFGVDRYLNQRFYTSREWKRIRDHVIARDLGCDLGVSDIPIYGKIIIHHMNPVTIDDITENPGVLLDPEFLICVSDDTHRFIHYGFSSKEDQFVERRSGDTCPWR